MCLAIFCALLGGVFPAPHAPPDGLVRPPANFPHSLQERAQEAILIFQDGKPGESGVQQTILKITTRGDINHFSWVVPFPNPPEVFEEDAAVFRELFDYVQWRLAQRRFKNKSRLEGAMGPGSAAADSAVTVHSYETVGSYDVAVVGENDPGGLNAWLRREGFRPVEGAKGTLDFYRRRGFVFACIKVSEHKQRGEKVHTHPLRFRFRTGSSDAIYFPMKLTGVQDAPFDVNLYVFRNSWINGHLNRFGYEHRGFKLRWKDFDGPQCKRNTGKIWSNMARDPYLRPFAPQLRHVEELFQKVAPGKPFYLTNILRRGVDPRHVRGWDDDLWLVPYYTDPTFVPYHYQDPPYNVPANSLKRSASLWWLPGSTTGGAAILALAGCALLWLPARRRLARRRR